jgi:hypothetical protein
MAEHRAVAAGLDPHESTTVSILDAAKANPKAVIYCILMTFGPLIYGFDNIIVRVITVVPAFQQVICPPPCPLVAAGIDNLCVWAHVQRNAKWSLLYPCAVAAIVERIYLGRRDDRIDCHRLRRRSFWPKDLICGGRHNWYCGCRCYLYVRHERLVTERTWGLLGRQGGSGNFSRHAQLDLSDIYF